MAEVKSKKRIGILRGGPSPRRSRLWPREGGMGDEYSVSLKKGGEIITYITENLGDKYNKAIDEGGLGQFTPGVSSSWDIRPEYQQFFKKYSDKSGDYVEFPVYQKVDPFNVSTAANYNHAHFAKTTEENPYRMGQEEQLFEDEAGNLFDAKGQFVRKK